MTLQQITKFISESEELNWNWDRLQLIGGEPTLHINFIPIVRALIEYRERHPSSYIALASNGRGRFPQLYPFIRDNNINVYISSKPPLPAKWHDMHQAPCDIGIPYYGLNCVVLDNSCGLGMSPLGYFLCGAGAGIARIAGLDIGIKSLKDVTIERLEEQGKVLCPLCGHYRGGIPYRGPGNESPTWKKILDK